MPAPFISVPNTAQIEMIYTAASERVENVYHVVGSTPWDAAGLAALTTYFVGWENGTAKLLRSDNVVLVLVRAIDMSSVSGAEVETTEAITGSIGTGHLPNNVTISIKANTGLRGRSYRGRTFWIGVNDSQLDPSGQGMLATPLNSIVSALNNLRGGVIPNSGKMAVVSKRNGGVPRTTGVATPIIEYVAIDPNIDSQRRRLIGHNRHS